MTFLTALLMAAAPIVVPPAVTHAAPIFDLQKHDTDFSDVPLRPGVFLSKHGSSGEAIYLDPFGQIENIV